nr:immunoglobulin heavy chain junction region [Mus musculus]
CASLYYGNYEWYFDVW